MSDTINIDKSVKSFHSSPENGEYSKVILHIDDETYVEAGNDTGRTLEANCPFATQQIANNLLNRLKGFRYQPYAADGAFFDPATELGDGVTVGDIFGGIYSQDIKFDSLCGSNIEAPQDGDIEHEYPYEAKKDREVTRQIKKRVTQSQAESIINQEMDKITLSVSGEGGATTFEIKKDTATLSSETVDLKVKSVNIEGELSADKITTGTMSADRLEGGTLTLGGQNNDYGVLSIRDLNNDERIRTRYGDLDIIGSTYETYTLGTNGLWGYWDREHTNLPAFYLYLQPSGDYAYPRMFLYKAKRNNNQLVELTEKIRLQTDARFQVTNYEEKGAVSAELFYVFDSNGDHNITWTSKGVNIPSGTNILTLTAGRYYATSASGLTNCPTTTDFALFVYDRSADSDKKSYYIHDGNNNIYINSQTGANTYSGWKRLNYTSV